MRSFPAGAVFALTLAWSSAVVASPQVVAVTTCGQLVERGTIGYLTADLDCTATPDDPAVIVDRHARLDLRGFTITGGSAGVWCGFNYNDPNANAEHGKCQIIGGGGVIQNATYSCVESVGLVASNLTIRNCGFEGVRTNVAKLSTVTLTGNGGNGVAAFSDVKVVNSTVTGNGFSGVQSYDRKVKVIDSTVVDNGHDVQCGAILCGDIFSARRPLVKDTVCESSIKLGNPIGTWGVCSLD